MRAIFRKHSVCDVKSQCSVGIWRFWATEASIHGVNATVFEVADCVNGGCEIAEQGKVCVCIE